MKLDQALNKKYPWGKDVEWKLRTGVIAGLIKQFQAKIPVNSILDVGGGLCNLYKYLSEKTEYVSIDIKPYSDKTVVCDLNNDPLPDLHKFDIIVLQGILEYVETPMSLLKSLKRYGNRAILTYRKAPSKVKRLNQFDWKQIEMIIDLAEWKIDWQHTLEKRKNGETVEKILTLSC